MMICKPFYSLVPSQKVGTHSWLLLVTQLQKESSPWIQSVTTFSVKKQGEWNEVSLSIPRLMLLRIGIGMRLVDVIRAAIRINLEVDPNHAKKLHATTVEGWATGK